ncbi:AtpZ/AtpI family protein [Arthrobacter sp. C152]
MRDPKKSGPAARGRHGSNGSAPADSGASTDGGYNAGMAVFSYIIGGIIVWSLIGWGLDYVWGTRWIVLAGALLGAVGGFYLSHKHGLTSSRTNAGDRRAASGPSQDGDTNAK